MYSCPWTLRLQLCGQAKDICGVLTVLFASWADLNANSWDKAFTTVVAPVLCYARSNPIVYTTLMTVSVLVGQLFVTFAFSFSRVRLAHRPHLLLGLETAECRAKCIEYETKRQTSLGEPERVKRIVSGVPKFLIDGFGRHLSTQASVYV